MVKPKIKTKVKAKPKLKPKTKPKLKYNKQIRPKIQIGRDLVKDTVGTNQLLDYNNIINVLQKNIIIDDTKAKLYKENLDQQLKNQQYANDPNLQYQLKKQSKKLYKDLKDSIFKGDDDKSMIKTTRKQLKTKVSNILLTPFEQSLKAQTEINKKFKSSGINAIPKQIGSINQTLDKFLVDKSESMKDKLITPELINKWRNKFEKLPGFKENKDLDENFSTIVLSYFDDPEQRILLNTQDVKLYNKKYNVYKKLDEQQRKERFEKEQKEQQQKEQKENERIQKERFDYEKSEVYRILQTQQKLERDEKARLAKLEKSEKARLAKLEKSEQTFNKKFAIMYKSNPDYERIKKVYLNNEKFSIASSRVMLNKVKYAKDGTIKKMSIEKKKELDGELKKYENENPIIEKALPQDLKKIFKEDEKLLNYSTEIPKAIKLKTTTGKSTKTTPTKITPTKITPSKTIPRKTTATKK